MIFLNTNLVQRKLNWKEIAFQITDNLLLMNFLLKKKLQTDQGFVNHKYNSVIIKNQYLKKKRSNNKKILNILLKLKNRKKLLID